LTRKMKPGPKIKNDGSKEKKRHRKYHRLATRRWRAKHEGMLYRKGKRGKYRWVVKKNGSRNTKVETKED